MPDDPKRIVRLAQPTFPDLDLDAVAQLLGSGWLTNAGQVRAFEQAFADYQGVEHAVAVSSCTAALHLALLAHGVGPGDEVITTPFTFAATCNAIIHAGATPVLVDVEPDTLNIDPNRIELAISAKTKAVMPVHFAGHPADLDALLALRERHGFALIHDAAHSAEARYRGRSMAQHADTACFSFYATKNLPIGEGGMLTTHDPEIARTARLLRNHGMSADAFDRHGDAAAHWRHWDLARPGFNYKMAELPALLGRGQLPHLPAWRDRRAAVAERYETLLARVDGVRVLGRRAEVTHAHHLFVILIDRKDVERDALASRLKANGVEVSINYRPIHELDWYRRTFDWNRDDFPVASHASERCISLPMHPELSVADADLVVERLQALLEGG